MSEAGNEENPLKSGLNKLVQALDAAGKSSLLVSDDALLRSIVEAAASIFQAAAASILLINEEENVLEFKVATGEADQDLVGMRIPLNQGIAGYVAMTGQPISISNVEQDPRFNRDFAKSTGYVPRSILAMPLISGVRILGVMEVLDKIDAPSFGMRDMELMGIFTRQVALAIEISQGMERLSDALAAGLRGLAASAGLHDEADLLSGLGEDLDDPHRNDLLDLAILLNEFTHLGEDERKTAQKILTAFAEYSRSRRRAVRGADRR